MKKSTKVKFSVVEISGVAVGVGIRHMINGVAVYSECICETLFDTGNDEKDAENSRKWATKICNALNRTKRWVENGIEIKK